MSKILEKLNASWENLLLQMKEDFEISDRIFDAFIKDVLKPVKYEKNTLYIEVPEEGYISFLQNRVLSQLRITIANAISISPEDLEIILLTKNSQNSLKNKDNDLDLLLKTIGKINKDNTFENFVKGPSNALAYASCIAVAENPGENNYNPLFIYGKTGLGKTHLMHAIAIHALKKNPNLKILFTTCDNFISDFVRSLEKHTINDFKNRYRNVDILLIDDIHSLHNAEQTQEEFFNTFNSLYEKKAQIIVSSDKPLKEIAGLEDRIVSRLAWGLSCDIQMPDYETRLSILRKKEEIRKPLYPIDNEVMKYIAQNVKSNIRELESALTAIILYSKIINQPITLELAKERLSDLKNKEDKKLTPNRINEIVCDYFSVNMLDVCGPKRNREFVYARDIAIYLCRDQIKDITQEKIGNYFGNRDHSTVINSCLKIEKRIKTDKELAENIKNIKEKLLL